MVTRWVRRLALLAACVALSCKGGGGKDSPAAAKDDVPAALADAGAEVQWAGPKKVAGVTFKNRTVSDDTLAEVARWVPGLTTLTLSGCPEPPASRLKAVARLTNLSRLHLTDCKWVTDADLKDLAPLTKLQRLNLAGCTRVTDAGLKQLAGIKSLRRLELRDCTEITDAGLNELVALPNLEELGVAACPRLTEKGLEELKKTLKNCTIRTTDY